MKGVTSTIAAKQRGAARTLATCTRYSDRGKIEVSLPAHYAGPQHRLGLGFPINERDDASGQPGAQSNTGADQ